MSSVEYNIIDEKWILVTDFNAQIYDTQEEAIMAQRNVDWLVTLQEATANFYAAMERMRQLNAEWDTIYSQIVSSDELAATSVIGTTHDFGPPTGLLTNSQLASVMLAMEGIDTMGTDYATYRDDFVMVSAVR